MLYNAFRVKYLVLGMTEAALVKQLRKHYFEALLGTTYR